MSRKRRETVVRIVAVGVVLLFALGTLASML